MTRKEEIISAAREYNNGITLSSPSNVLHFEAGARWADENPKNIWHDADEEPLLENEEIIYVDNTIHAGICSMFGSTFGTWDNDMCWKDYVKHNHIVKWAYINDFLQKGNKDGFKSIL